MESEKKECSANLTFYPLWLSYDLNKINMRSQFFTTDTIKKIVPKTVKIKLSSVTKSNQVLCHSNNQVEICSLSAQILLYFIIKLYIYFVL